MPTAEAITWVMPCQGDDATVACKLYDETACSGSLCSGLVFFCKQVASIHSTAVSLGTDAGLSVSSRGPSVQ